MHSVLQSLNALKATIFGLDIKPKREKTVEYLTPNYINAIPYQAFVNSFVSPTKLVYKHSHAYIHTYNNCGVKLALWDKNPFYELITNIMVFAEMLFMALLA